VARPRRCLVVSDDPLLTAALIKIATLGGLGPVRSALAQVDMASWSTEGVQLREAPSSRESRTDPLSIRDLMNLAFLPNERIASKNFLFENEYMKKHKLKQVVDVVFGVHDDRAVELGQRIKELGARLTQARSELAAARAFVDEQDVPTVGALIAEQYEGELRELTEQLRVLDEAAHAGTTFAGRLRREHQQAAQHARRAASVVRDCETQLARMMPLRA
jgi:hypothetical protein